MGVDEKNVVVYRELKALRDVYEICENVKCPKCGGKLNPGCSIAMCEDCEYEVGIVGSCTLNYCKSCPSWRLKEDNKCWIRDIMEKEIDNGLLSECDCN